MNYFSKQVEKEILNLPAGLLARYLRLTDMKVEFGSNLGMPHAQSVGNGLNLLGFYSPPLAA